MASPEISEAASRQFEGKVSVSSTIVDYLSSGLYKNPAACLKELINNAYDADATEVIVSVKPDAQSIVIQDNGTGFSRDTFVRHFSRLSESHKRDDTDLTRTGRPKIGKIGIGFIAANEICDYMEILTTERGNADVMHVSVDFRLIREPIESRREVEGEVYKGDYHGEITTGSDDDHYTIISLTGIREDAQPILVDALRSRGVQGDGRSLYGLTLSKFQSELGAFRKSWSDYDHYSTTMMGVALNIPVRYLPEWIPQKDKHRVRRFETQLESLNFTVTYDGLDLRKPVVLSAADGETVLRNFELNGQHFSAHGYLYAQHGTIYPENLNGILVRIRHAAVGTYDPGFLEFPLTIGSLFQRWITGELWCSDGLEPAMNIDRATLRDGHPAYSELQTLFHQELDEFIKVVRRDLYEKPNQKRRVSKASVEVARVQDIVERSLPKTPNSTATATRIANAWRQETGTALNSPTASLLRRYSVSEIYEIVLDIARDLLDPSSFDEFVSELTRRLRSRR